MRDVALTHLVPLAEMTPGQVGAIRNQVISQLVKQVSMELNVPIGDLVVRDVRPFSDLAMYAGGTTAATVDEWLYDATTTTAAAFTSVSGNQTMGDQRYVALFGVRDLRWRIGVHTTKMEVLDSTEATGAVDLVGKQYPGQMVSLVKIAVGGSDKVIWDTTSIQSYIDQMVGLSPSAVIIPQNATYNIYYYFKTTAAGIRANLQLIGVAVEPRGKVISP